MKLFFYIATFFMSSLAFAGGGHFHPKKVASCSKVCTAEDIKAAAHLGGGQSEGSTSFGHQ